MNDRDAISRRALLRGKFFPRQDCGATDDTKATFRQGPDGTNPPLVMRYPKTTSDVAPARRYRGAIPLMRPPGAVEETVFLAECTRCDACIEACPPNAIQHASPRFREAAGTPMIDPDRQPCVMCDDLPCIAACEPNVLSMQVSKTMGTARITEQTCLAHHNMTCTVCSEHCPVDDAIALTDGTPRINEDACTGCGVCRSVCPSPENAVLLMPTFVRPGPASTKEARDESA